MPSGYHTNTEIITLKFFYIHSQAELYAVRLRSEGIKCFVSNAHTSTLIPLGQGGIGLHVNKQDAERATEIVNSLDLLNRTDPEENFYDADKDDILYEKEKRSKNFNRKSPLVVLLIGLLIILLLVMIIVRLRIF